MDWSTYLIIIYLPKTYTIITVTQNPSTNLFSTWTLWGRNEEAASSGRWPGIVERVQVIMLREAEG